MIQLVGLVIYNRAVSSFKLYFQLYRLLYLLSKNNAFLYFKTKLIHLARSRGNKGRSRHELQLKSRIIAPWDHMPLNYFIECGKLSHLFLLLRYQ